MTYLEFKNKWLGKSVDIDKAYGAQCADLIKRYLLECYAVPNGDYGDAIDYWNKPHANVLKHFEKSASRTPAQGDIIILDLAAPYGHIAIADSATTMLEQNGGSGNGDGKGANAIRISKIPTTKIVGILKPKKETKMDTFTGDFGGKKTTKNAEGWYKSAVSYRQRLIDEQAAHKKTKDAWAKESEYLSGEIATQLANLNALRTENKNLANQLQKAAKNEVSLQSDIEGLIEETERIKKELSSLRKVSWNVLEENQELTKKLESGLTGWQMVVEGIKKMFNNE